MASAIFFSFSKSLFFFVISDRLSGHCLLQVYSLLGVCEDLESTPSTGWGLPIWTEVNNTWAKHLQTGGQELRTER